VKVQQLEEFQEWVKVNPYKEVTEPVIIIQGPYTIGCLIPEEDYKAVQHLIRRG
jgi:hypothetical protein